MLAKQERLRNAALVVVDMQNDFVREGAPLEVPDARRTIAPHETLIAAFRQRSRPVVYTKFITFPHEVLLWEWSPQCRPPIKCCWKGHRRFYADVGRELDCTEVVGELAPVPGDPIIEKIRLRRLSWNSAGRHFAGLRCRGRCRHRDGNADLR
jgi:nicotinamidase-related amidase